MPRENAFEPNKYSYAPEFAAFVEKHPRLMQKLIFWAGKRHKHYRSSCLSYAGMKEVYNDVAEEIKTYIVELIIASEDYYSPAKNAEYIHKWRNRLSEQEKAAISRHLPEEMVTSLKVVDKIWYDIGNGYQVANEPIIDQLSDTAIVTVNSYNSHVLNVDNMLIVDVDLDSNSKDSVIALSKQHALKALKSFCEERPKFGFRVYETRGGLRYICTTDTFHPETLEVNRIFRCLYTDPLYMSLCKFQGTFRARLTPKPWRVGDCEEVSRWEYDRQKGLVLPSDKEWDGVRTCELLMSVGEDKIIEPFAPIVEYHDSMTGALELSDILLA